MKKPVRKRKVARKRPEYVTREMLADLRDEIEDVLEGARQSTSYATDALDRYRLSLPAAKRLDLAHDRCKQLEKTISQLEIELRRVRLIIGPEETEPNAPELAERVTWSYFHSWIRQINQRLDELEKRK
jgi:hypothetical protein